MSHLFTIAFILALFNWIPILGLTYDLGPEFKRGPIRILCGLSIVFALYEGFMSFVWAPSVVAPIRLDIFLLMIPASLVYLGYGIAYYVYASSLRFTEPEKRKIRAIAICCLAVPILCGAGLFGMSGDSRQLNHSFDQGRRYRFEARLRDEKTQERFFGDVKSKENSLAGFYVGDGKDDRFAKLIVNENLDVWLFDSALYENHGVLKHLDDGSYEWQNEKNAVTMLKGKIQRLDADTLSFSGGFGTNPEIRTTVFTKAATPQFPVDAKSNNEVEFLGVFSTVFDDNGKYFGVLQVWLWRAGNKIWGQHYRVNTARGNMVDFISATDIEPYCMGSCDGYDLRFQIDHSRYQLKRTSPDSWTLKELERSNSASYQLKRGVIVPGFLFDLAPLHSAEENKNWLAAVKAGEFIKWQVPEHIDLVSIETR